MSDVYVYDRTDGLVKISEKQGKYYIYPLKEVRLKRGEKPNFIFEKSAKKIWSYKPYEDEDVSPIKKFFAFKLRQVI